MYSYQYNSCRCDKCRHANTVMHQDLMARYRAGGGSGKHGTPYSYDTGCRCDPCRLAHNEKSLSFKRKRRESRSA